MLMITPPPWPAMTLLTACATRNIPRRFTAMMRSQSAAEMSRNASRRDVPALLASTSIPPSVAVAVVTSFATSSCSLTSHAMPSTSQAGDSPAARRPPAARTSPAARRPATASVTSAWSMPQMNTLHPSSRKRRAAARPIPLLPPLTSTRLPESPRIPPPSLVSAATIRGDPLSGPRFRSMEYAGGVQENDDSPVASVDRALRILTVVGSAARGLSLDDLAVRLGIPKSSLHRILAALKFRRYVSQPEPGGPYFLGPEMLATAFRFHDALDLRALIHPLLAQISDELNETTHMAVLDGAEVIYQDKIE